MESLEKIVEAMKMKKVKRTMTLSLHLTSRQIQFLREIPVMRRRRNLAK